MEQQVLQYLYKNSPFAIVMTLLLCAMQASVVEHSGNGLEIFFWFAGLLTVQIFRFADYWRFKLSFKGDAEATQKHFRNFRFGILLTGLFLGLFPLLIVDSVGITEMVFVAFVSAGITAASTGSIGLDAQSHGGFLAATLIPLLICFYQIGGYMPSVMGTMIIFYMLYLGLIGTRFRRQLIANLELHQETLESRKESARRQLMSELIARVLGAYLDKGFSPRLLELLTHEIVKLSGAQYGFLCQLNAAAESGLVHSHVLVNSGNLDLAQIDRTIRLDEAALHPQSLDAHLTSVLREQRDLYLDHIEIYEAEPRTIVLGSFCGIPLFCDGQVIALVGIVDRHNSISMPTVEFLRPLLNTLERLMKRQMANQQRAAAMSPFADIAV